MAITNNSCYSVAGVLKPEMVKSMAENPIVFALSINVIYLFSNGILVGQSS